MHEAIVTAVLVLPGAQCFYDDIGKIESARPLNTFRSPRRQPARARTAPRSPPAGQFLTNVLHMAPPECLQGRHILGWAPLRRRARGDALSARDRSVVTEFLSLRGRMHPGLQSKVAHARMRIPADPRTAPFLVAQVAVTRPQTLLQVDVVCCEASLAPRPAALAGAAWQHPMDLRRRPVEILNVKALGEGHKHYGLLQPDVGAQLTFLSPQGMAGMLQACQAQVCSQIAHEARAASIVSRGRNSCSAWGREPPREQCSPVLVAHRARARRVQEEGIEGTYTAALKQLRADQLALSRLENDVEALRRAVAEAEAPQRHRNGA